MNNLINKDNKEIKTRISAVIITFNEEKNIRRCLESIQDIVDEVIVVDSFSTDKTQEICEEFNVKFVQYKWQGYSKTKNYANELASNEFILSIDADEALSEELQKSILRLKAGEELSRNIVYSLNRLTNYCGKWIYHCGWYPDKKIRIFNKSNASWKGELHEELVFVDGNTKIQHLEGNLLHFSYNSISQHILQVDKFTEIGAKEAHNKGKRTSILGIILRPIWKFLRDYIIKLGFLDGYYGFVICAISAFATFVKYIKLKQYYK